MLNLFQYGFIIRGFEAGLIIALIAPLIGLFLVLRRYSLIADTLSHVSLAGVAIGLFLGFNPIATAIAVSIISSVFIERLRISKKVFGESALAIFLSGSLAVAVIIISLAHGFSVDLFNYLFGSIVTVKQSDVSLIAGTGAAVIIISLLFYKELLFVTFDEEAARVAGLPTKALNIMLITLTALTVSLAIPIVGVLLISTLIVVPVVAALQFGTSFRNTLIVAESISLFSVIAGIIISFYLNLSTGGTIVLLSIGIFLTVYIYKNVLQRN